jgi:hypothetical protein
MRRYPVKIVLLKNNYSQKSDRVKTYPVGLNYENEK